MKQLNLLKTMLLLCALIVGSNAWAADDTITFSELGLENGVQYTEPFNGGDFTVTFAGGSNDGKYYNTGSGIRVYGNGTMTIAATGTKKLAKIELTFDGSSYKPTSNDVVDGGTYDNTTGTWTGSAESVVFTRPSGSGHWRVKSVAVTYSTSSKPNAGVSASDIAEMISGTSKADFYTITAEDYDGTLNFTSNHEEYAKVEGGVLKAIAPGTAKITISAAESEKYASVNTSFNVTVKNRDAVAPEGSAAGGYSLVTDASTLKAGDQLVFVNEDEGIIMAAQADNNRRGTDVTITESKISTPLPENSAVITLEGSTGAWNFKTSDGYLYAASSSSNQMKSRAEVGDDNNATATISIAEGDATITFSGSNRPRVRYNPNGGNPVFSCYTTSSTTGSLPQIYRFSASSSFDVTIGSSGWRTLISAKNVSLPEGVKAYIVTESSSSTVSLTEVASVKANEPYLLNGPAGDCTLTVIDTPAEPTGNLLQITDASTGNDVYVLSKKGDEVGFRRWTGGNLGAGRVYLPAPAADVREFISFSDGETTAINDVRGKMSDVRGDYFDLSGRKVVQPTKGLYIVNGKKVVIR